MSHETVPLAYATPVQTWLSAPIRWTLIVWASLVLMRHGLYWSREAIEMWDWKGSRMWTWIDVTPTMFAFIALTIEVVGLLMILTGAIGNTDRTIRRLGTGSFLVLIAMAISICVGLFVWIDRWNAMRFRNLSYFWQIVSMLAASSPVLLALLTWRDHRIAMNRDAS